MKIFIVAIGVVIGLIILYFVIKWAVRDALIEAYRSITGKKTAEDLKNEEEYGETVNENKE